MEEQVGQFWHRFITRAATVSYKDAAVELSQVHKTVGLLFRALGGDVGLRVEAATATEHGAKRSWLQRIAGNNKQVILCWRDSESLRLPPKLDLFPEKALNRDLYLWLAALAAEDNDPTIPWFTRNQQLTQHILQQFPGVQSRYQRLVTAQLALRPDLKQLSAEECAQEQAIQQALREPGSVSELSIAKQPPLPVYLWLHPSPPINTGSAGKSMDKNAPQANKPPSQRNQEAANKGRRRSERVDSPDGKKGLLAFRLESLFTQTEYVKVDRTTDDELDSDQAKQALEDMEIVSVMRDGETVATTLKFDLDLPNAEDDDTPLQTGILLPEWDYKRQQLRPDYCRLYPQVAIDAQPIELPTHLRRTARYLRAQFEALVPTRQWHKGQQDGNEIDLDAYLLHAAECQQGQVIAERGLYRDFRASSRNLACLLLADLSMSTDAWVSNSARVIDVIRDSLFLFAEALTTTGDSFAMYGFCSRYRDHIEFHTLKEFKHRYNAIVRGRINAIKPGFYTRMGAAIRHASQLLSKQPTEQRLLLLLTDGKPNDLDQYEGRYGVEDTRMALQEARKQGLQIFCVTIDETAEDYLPHLFGTHGYVVIRKPSELPKELPLLYARLTQK